MVNRTAGRLPDRCVSPVSSLRWPEARPSPSGDGNVGKWLAYDLFIVVLPMYTRNGPLSMPSSFWDMRPLSKTSPQARRYTAARVNEIVANIDARACFGPYLCTPHDEDV